jgi:hypothetical protein
MMKTIRTVSSAVLWGSLMAPAMLLASGCNGFGLACTQIGCDDGVSVLIRGLELNQSYEVDVATADAIIKCTIDTDDAATQQMRMQCDQSLFYFSQMDDAHIEVANTPERVEITVRQNGTMILQDEVTPDYDEVAPNGEACGPICLHAEVPVQL